MKKALLYVWVGVYIIVGQAYVQTMRLFGWYKYVSRIDTVGEHMLPAHVYTPVLEKCPRWLQKVWNKGFSGHTIGNVIVVRYVEDAELIDHEFFHVEQYVRLGPFFLPLYLMGYVAAWAAREDAYAMNPLELAVRRKNGEEVDYKR